jgi:PAS domain S-box-containing protein
MSNTSNSARLQLSTQELLDENEYLREKVAAIEAAAKLKQDLHQTLSRSINIGYWEWDEITKRPAYLSKEMASIMGMSQESLNEQYQCEEDFFPFIHPDDLEHYIKNICVVVHSDNPRGLAHAFDYRIVRPNGEVRHVRELEYGKLKEDGVNTRSFGAVQDITELKEREQDLKKRDALVRQFELIPEIGHYICNLDTERYIYVSSGFASIFGVSTSQFLQRVTSFKDDIALLHEDDQERLAEIYKNRKVDIHTDEVYRVRRLDGEIRWIREKSIVIRDSISKENQSIGVLQDITEQKNIEQSLLESKDSLEMVVKERTQELAETIKQLKHEIKEREMISSELENKNAELERFAYTVSHDLKSPLITIKGFVGLLDKDIAASDGDGIANDMEKISSAADKMGALLNDVLELSRIGRVMGESVTCNLSEIAKQAISLVETKVDELGVEIVIEDMPNVNGDEMRLVEVYLNLIENAIKFMGGQQSPRVHIGSVEKDGMIHCFVRDNGVGMATEYHDQVFGLFERLGADMDGSGVGLALVKRIIEVHGGEIWIESDGLGHGSNLTFTLPKTL